jgi:hypothetical protein
MRTVLSAITLFLAVPTFPTHAQADEQQSVQESVQESVARFRVIYQVYPLCEHSRQRVKYETCVIGTNDVTSIETGLKRLLPGRLITRSPITGDKAEDWRLRSHVVQGLAPEVCNASPILTRTKLDTFMQPYLCTST